ncbi:MAG: hypothetical protein Q7S61_00150 [bacterium]|nr:hypothetical protein [bacterium]
MISSYQIRKYGGFSRENASTLTAFAVIPILMFLLMISIKNYTALQEQYNNTQTELTQMDSKVKALNSVKNVPPQELDDLNQLLTQLMPETEDLFSVIYAIETLSNKTGFIISSYTINLDKSKGGKLSIAVDGVGNEQTFLQFIQSYRYEGGRLITIEKIDMPSRGGGNLKLDLNFYAKQTPLAQTQTTTEFLQGKDLELLRSIKDKVKIVIKDDSNTSVDYPTKDNPFE